jgi:hypothetical protein
MLAATLAVVLILTCLVAPSSSLVQPRVKSVTEHGNFALRCVAFCFALVALINFALHWIALFFRCASELRITVLHCFLRNGALLRCVALRCVVFCFLLFIKYFYNPFFFPSCLTLYTYSHILLHTTPTHIFFFLIPQDRDRDGRV